MRGQTDPHIEYHSQEDIAISELGDAVSTFGKLRPRLFRIAYRFRGSVGEAEDIVQEAWIRWQTCDRSTVRDVPAFLSSLTQRLSINAGKSARVRHETFVGQLPEQRDSGIGPDLAAERVEALEDALWLVLERLSPNERAAFLLREAFDYSYEQIAGVIHQTNASVRQLVSRARKHLANGKRADVGIDEHQRLLDAFVIATRTGDMSRLEELLIDDLVRETEHRRSHPPQAVAYLGLRPLASLTR